MKGLEISEKFYNEFGKPALKENFPELFDKLCVGLVGSGSECLGFDDEISKDHDFEAGFCIFVPDTLTEKEIFGLERAYSKLPDEFMGIKKSKISPVGGSRHGVFKTSDFYLSKTGTKDGVLSLYDWFNLPEFSLLEAVNGKVFSDNLGEFTKIRERLLYYPEDVRLKKLAGNLFLMGQSGRYNYLRCIKRNDTAGAQLCIFEFVKAVLNIIFILNKQYMPYYKWSFCALKNLDVLSNLYSDLEFLISNPNNLADKKTEITQNIVTSIFDELKKQELTSYKGLEAEGYAYSVNDLIKDNNLRNTNILMGV